MHIKKSLLVITALLTNIISTTAQATSFPFDLNEGDTIIHQQNSTQGVTLYEYPDPSKVVDTGVLFFYTKDLLDYYDGDVTKIYDFVNSSIDVNNQALSSGGIGIRRVVAGILPMPEQFVDSEMYNPSNPKIRSSTEYFGWGITGAESYHDYYKDGKKRFGQKKLLDEIYGQYKASYYVALARRYKAPSEELEDKYKWVGLAILGGELSIVTPYDNKQHHITILSHELGHNDGLRHNAETEEKRDNLGPYAAGAFCDNNYSVMDSRGFSYNEDYFFSDVNHKDTSTSIACGEVDVADSSLSYREAINAGWVDNKRDVFRNIRDVNPRIGYASIQFDDASFNEAEGRITGVVVWEGVSEGDNAFVEVVISNYQDTDIADFSGAPSTHVAFNGESTTEFSIDIADDEDFEITENVSFALRNPNGVNIDSTSSEALIAVESDDAGQPGKFSFSSTSYDVTEGQSVTIIINRSGGADGKITLQVSTEDGTATADSDYTAVSQSVTFGNTETQKSIIVRTTSDTVSEGNETLTVRIANENAAIENSSATVTIANKSAGTNTTNSNQDSSGGGSMNLSMICLALIAIMRRRNLFSFGLRNVCKYIHPYTR